MTDDAPAADPPPPEEGEERHASWLELFFDLVVVAGIGALAHLLHEDSTVEGLALYAVAFTAFWLVWACFATYGNIAAERTRTRTMLVGMAAMAVMVAAVPGVDGEHAQAFAIAYIVGRFVAAGPWQRGTVVVDLPVVQAGVGVVPWIVSLWFTEPTQQRLWAVGLTIDIVVLVVGSRERLVASSEARLERARAQAEERAHALASESHRGRRRDHADVDPDQLHITVAGVAVPHLAERLSLFMLIVLGESLIQAIDGAAEATWDSTLFWTGLAAFVLLVGLWTLSVRFGSAGVALLTVGGLPPRPAWVAHLLTTGAVATLAAVVATLTAEPRAVVGSHERLLVACAVLVYAGVAVIVHAWRRDASRAAAVGIPFAVAGAVTLLDGEGTASSLAMTLAAGALAASWCGEILRRREAGESRRDRRRRPRRRGENPPDPAT